MGLEGLDWGLLLVAAALAGLLDAMVGGGGLVLVPSVFALWPQGNPANLFALNKAVSIWGTAVAGVRYARRVRMVWSALLPAVGCTLVGSAVGAWFVTRVDAQLFRLALPWALALLLVYTLIKKDLGLHHAPRMAPRAQALAMASAGLLIGAYDGFFGPGTGSFLVFVLVRTLGFDFLHASAHAKVLNAASNLAALLWFGWHGYVWWGVALGAAVANVAGGWLGASLALQRGAGFVRVVFMLVVALLIAKTAHQAYAV
ncbi:MAG: hypothetical protein RLZ34_1428 [Pseudomonadota bacterium]|jgi:uncharacterized membrane protein YfcA